VAKKRAINQPIVAEEPARPEEQFQLDETAVAPPSSRPIGPRSSVTGSKSAAKSYGARSASERRASRSSRAEAPRRDTRRVTGGMRADVVADRLEHPTLTVTEADLRKAYSYVTNDLRSMAILAVILIVGLIIVAQVLPK